ncbi:MAG: ATP-binding protein [Candidatus Zixiibacteriota bacterium]
MTPPSQDTARLVIPSDPKRIAEADEFLEDLLRRHGIPESLVMDLAIVTSELVNNAIVHGNRGDAAKTVSLSVKINRDKVVIRVSDEGEGFDPAAIPDPLANENLLREVGRGVFIVRSLMDDVRFERGPAGQTTVEVSKRLTSD